MTPRRRFLVSAASLAALGPVACSRRSPPAPAPREPAPLGAADPTPDPSAEETNATPNRKTVLVLGGTGFLGPHVVRAALDAGYEVTLFNRGRTNPHLFPDLEQIHGDRDGKLDALQTQVESGRRWNAVIDTSGYVPRIVEASASLLAPASEQYLFVSSISVYAQQSKMGLEENDPVGRLDDPTVEKIDEDTYGPLKALCEEVAEANFPGHATVVRPGLIVGPGDPTDRFTYWPVRVARGGDMMAPGNPSDPVQVIDVRDLATWMITCIREGHHGRFNAAGPAERLEVGEMLGTCIESIGSDAQPVWVSAAFLEQHDVHPWVHMTVWVPPEGEAAGMGGVSNARAIAAGMTFRPLAVTVTDTLAWWNDLPAERRAAPRAGLPAEREREVLKAWRKKSKE